jgi:hypothetical protein
VKVIRTSLEWSLLLLFIPSAFFSIEFFAVGVGFGFNLWRPDRLFAIAVWFAVVLFPGFVAWALYQSFRMQSLATTARLASAAWMFVAFAIWDIYIARWGW